MKVAIRTTMRRDRVHCSCRQGRTALASFTCAEWMRFAILPGTYIPIRMTAKPTNALHSRTAYKKDMQRMTWIGEYRRICKKSRALVIALRSEEMRLLRRPSRLLALGPFLASGFFASPSETVPGVALAAEFFTRMRNACSKMSCVRIASVCTSA